MKRFSSLVSASLVLLLVSGCALFSSGGDVTPKQITLIDDFDRTVELEGPAQRIISLSPSATEIFFALGVGGRMVGATEFCYYPVEALEIERVGGFGDPNLELIISLEPDLVIASSNHQTTVEALEALGIVVLALDPDDLQGIYQNIYLLGEATGTKTEAETLVQNMNTRITAVTELLKDIPAAERPTVYYEVWYPDPMTVGGDTFIHEIITLAGGINIAAHLSRYPVISEEVLLNTNPAVILHGHYDGSTAFFAARPGWDALGAVQQERVFFVDQDIFNRTGPRFADAVESLAKLLYPDLFE